MSIGLLIVTHDHIGRELLAIATRMLGVCPLPCDVVAVPLDSDPQLVFEQACKQLRQVDQGEGILVLTDMYGSTPSNIANRLLSTGNVRVVAGINLPMLVRILNYPRLSLDELAHKALCGGRDGVLECHAPPGN